MKTILFAFFLLLVVASCKQEIDLYEGRSSLFFSDKNSNDTLVFTWGDVSTDIKVMQYKLPVKLFGKVTDYPRSFRIRIVSDENDSLHSQVGVDYKDIPLEYTMPPLADHVDIELELYRTDTLRKQARRFTIQLLENEDFGFEYMRYMTLADSSVVMKDDHRVIYMNEDFPIPGWWGLVGNDIFGAWSMKKAILICDVVGIDRGVFIANLTGKEGELTQGYIRFAGRKMYKWLQEQNPPILEDDGTPMEMGRLSVTN